MSKEDIRWPIDTDGLAKKQREAKLTRKEADNKIEKLENKVEKLEKELEALKEVTLKYLKY